MTKKMSSYKFSPATEYWLNRILRDHAHQIFIIGSLCLISVVAITIFGIYAETNKSKQNIFSSTLNIINRSNTNVDTSITTNEQSIIIQNGEIISTPTKNPQESTYTCETIQSLPEYQYCTSDEVKAFDYIAGPNSLKVGNVSNYSISPNKNWLFIVTYSDEFVLSGGAPAENALVMVDVNNFKIHNLFSKIYFPNFTEESWSNDGKSLVLTTGYFTLNGKDYRENPYAVLLCSTTCSVIAEDAGPAGIGAEPAYFENGKIHYIDMNEQEILVSVP